MTEGEFLAYLRSAVDLDESAGMSSRLVDDLRLDSFDLVEVYLAIEEVAPEFAIPDQMDPNDIRIGDLHFFAFGKA